MLKNRISIRLVATLLVLFAVVFWFTAPVNHSVSATGFSTHDSSKVYALADSPQSRLLEAGHVREGDVVAELHYSNIDTLIAQAQADKTSALFGSDAVSADNLTTKLSSLDAVKQSEEVRATHAGIWVPNVQLGSEVKQGEVLGEVLKGSKRITVFIPSERDPGTAKVAGYFVANGRSMPVVLLRTKEIVSAQSVPAWIYPQQQENTIIPFVEYSAVSEHELIGQFVFKSNYSILYESVQKLMSQL